MYSVVQLHVNIRNHGFKESVVQLEKETQRLYCTIALFTNIHTRTGEQFDRNWLCNSKTSGHVHCFLCKLMSPTVSKVTCGFNDWKHAHKMLLSHENDGIFVCSKIIQSHRLWSGEAV